MLRIKSKTALEYDGQQVKLGGDELPSFLMANLSSDVEIDEGVTLAELLNLFFCLEQFIYDYTSNEYYVVSTVLNATKLAVHNQYTAILARREMIISMNNEVIMPIMVDFAEESNQKRYSMLRDLPIKIDTNLQVKSYEGQVIFKDLIQPFSLLDVVVFVFEELYYNVSNMTVDGLQAEMLNPDQES